MPLHNDVEAWIIEACRAYMLAGIRAGGGPKGRGPRSVVEFGSYAMHGHDPRYLFPGCDYIGVDPRPGPGVNELALAHEWVVSDKLGRYDVALSLQALEHDPHWKATLQAMTLCLRPGGLAIVTCAGPGWPEHEVETAPGPARHYRNVATHEVDDAMLAGGVELADCNYLPCREQGGAKRTAYYGFKL